MEPETNIQPPNKFSKQFLVIGALLIVGVVGVGLFVGQNKPQTSESSSPVATESESAIGISPSSDSIMKTETSSAPSGKTISNTFEVEGGGFYYKPNEIRVKKGEKVTITLKSVDMMHDFVIDEFNVKSDTIKGGNSTTFSFTPDKTGTFEFYCSVGSHRAQGMVGKLIVE